MANDIKRYPIEVWKIINLMKSVKGHLFTIEEDEKFYLKFRDNLPGEEFYFGILNVYKDPNGTIRVDVRRKPRDRFNTMSSDLNYSAELIQKGFDEWVSILEEYNELYKVTEDNDFEKYQKDFFEEIKSDTEEEYLNTDAQIKVDKLLEGIENKLIELNAAKNDPVLEDIKEEVKLLRETQGSYNKKKLAEKVAGIFAKIKKAGIHVLRAFWDEGKKQIIKKVIDGTFDGVGKYIDTIT